MKDMKDSAALEQRYRRLLALYPRGYRQEHEQEILSVLMAGATSDQRRPELAESADLLSNATRWRLRTPRHVWEEGHRPRLWVWIRVIIGAWLVLLTVILCSFGHWWALALLPFAAAHFFLALRLGYFVESQPHTGKVAHTPRSS